MFIITHMISILYIYDMYIIYIPHPMVSLAIANGDT